MIRFFDILIESLEDLCGSLSQRHDKLNYFGNLTDKICSDDEKMKGIYNHFVKNIFIEIDFLSDS